MPRLPKPNTEDGKYFSNLNCRWVLAVLTIRGGGGRGGGYLEKVLKDEDKLGKPLDRLHDQPVEVQPVMRSYLLYLKVCSHTQGGGRKKSTY